MVKNSRGQATTEAILLLALFFAVTITVTSQFEQNGVFANLVSGPWQRLDGMIRNGAWQPVNNSYDHHPLRNRTSYDSEDYD